LKSGTCRGACFSPISGLIAAIYGIFQKRIDTADTADAGVAFEECSICSVVLLLFSANCIVVAEWSSKIGCGQALRQEL
jgi:hypothetical protein